MRLFWHAIGSDARFTPRGWFKSLQRAAYVEGLRDANRIIEEERRLHWHEVELIAARVFARQCQQKIHRHSVRFAPELNQ